MRSSISSAVQVEPGRFARYRASHHAATNPMRYIRPYQWMRKGPIPNIGPIEMAMGLMWGEVSMRATLNSHSPDRNRLSNIGSRESRDAPGGPAPDRPLPGSAGVSRPPSPPWQWHPASPRDSRDRNR